MRCGLFLMPSHPPERPTAEAVEWDLSVVERADQLGFHEAWFGEHFTAPWEPMPAHDLIIAQALQRTDRMTLCSGAYLLPFHHPAELALRIAQLDHMAQGRYILGIGAGSVPTDFRLFDIDAAAGQQRAMTKEALEIMVRLWTDPDPWEYRGQYWNVNNPEPYLAYGKHLVPFQKPHPPIAVAGLSPRSETLRLAGECGYIPLSLTFNAQYLRGHWEVIEEGAASTGATCDRQDWRVIRDIVVADTDKEARQLAGESLMARHWRESNFPLLKAFDWLRYLKHDAAVADEDVTVDYLIDHVWLVGSPETVAERIKETDNVLGGFGTVIANCYDFSDQSDRWMHSLELLAKEVMPRLTG
jgi:alkanesulfonate monooxygenase SsuD/methylene tetrahydromethanopterin reductase-like flavin-dependent oxidoreductase (luciferase family)